MLYVKNNLKYAVMFKLPNPNGLDKPFSFDCRRVYQDTGNVATTGVTPISEDDFNALYTNVSVFKDHIDKGYLSKTKESGATSMANKMDSLEKENEILKAKLAELKKSESLGEELKEETVEEGASLKKQLEGTKKGKKAKAEVDESEGF